MEISGRIKFIGETQTFGSNGFRKREIVITTEEQYPQHIMIEFVQDKCDVLNGYVVGQFVEIGINLKGREWVNPQGETKYFNSIGGWKISIKESDNAEMPPVPPADAFEPKDDAGDEEEGEDDGMPF